MVGLIAVCYGFDELVFLLLCTLIMRCIGAVYVIILLLWFYWWFGRFGDFRLVWVVCWL